MKVSSPASLHVGFSSATPICATLHPFEDAVYKSLLCMAHVVSPHCSSPSVCISGHCSLTAYISVPPPPGTLHSMASEFSFLNKLSILSSLCLGRSHSLFLEHLSPSLIPKELLEYPGPPHWVRHCPFCSWSTKHNVCYCSGL